jgi:hypothetical protein
MNKNYELKKKIVHHYELSKTIVSYQEKDEQFLANAHFLNFGT